MPDLELPKEPRIFTLAEANALVPIFTQWLLQVQLLRQAVVNVIESKSDVAKGNGHILDDTTQTHHDLTTVSNAAGRIKELIDQINQTGAELKDLDLGLVDFAHIRKGQTVYLCWMLGEEKVSYWHELDAGAAGRKPL
jgi:hypothetical protein